jgi:hypothetical protein
VDKLLHISLLVRDTGLYDLLTAIEPHRVANLEVRAVAQANKMLALPAPNRSGRGGKCRHAIETTVPVGEKFNPLSVAKLSGVNRQSVYSEIGRMIGRKQIKRVSYGLYQRLT